MFGPQLLGLDLFAACAQQRRILYRRDVDLYLAAHCYMLGAKSHDTPRGYNLL